MFLKCGRKTEWPFRKDTQAWREHANSIHTAHVEKFRIKDWHLKCKCLKHFNDLTNVLMRRDNVHYRSFVNRVNVDLHSFFFSHHTPPSQKFNYGAAHQCPQISSTAVRTVYWALPVQTQACSGTRAVPAANISVFLCPSNS